MNMQVAQTQGIDIKAQVAFGRKTLTELRSMVRNRPDKLVINGKQYLDGMTPYVTATKEITKERKLESVEGITVLDVIGFWARAEVFQNGRAISAAESECLFEEKNWKGKPRFQVRSMAETRACAKALRQCLQWVVKLPAERGGQEFAEEAAEELTQQPLE